jgi:hypothetical protein
MLRLELALCSATKLHHHLFRLILYLATLLNLLISFCRFFLMESFKGFLHIRSYHLQRESFTSSFVILDVFYFFFIIALARTSSTTLNRNGKSSYA